MESFLPFLWFFLLAVMIELFVILDGADLGLGIMSLLAPENRRPLIIDAVGPLWYANETWLVIAGATLFGAFPHAYSLILSSLYVPVMMLIFGLMFRAVSTELRGHSRQPRFWNWAFGIGCLLAALGQGFLLGGLLTNPDAIRSSGSGAWSWLNPISVLIALGVAGAYVMIGAAHIISRRAATDVSPDVWKYLHYSIILALAIFLVVMALFPVMPSVYSHMWFQGPRQILVPLLSLVIVCCLIAALVRSRHKTRSTSPYAFSIAAFLGISGTIVAAIYPYIIPFSLSISEASSPISTQVFMLFGVGIVLPIIVVYNVYIAGVFSREASKRS